ncbi:hypothetical protein K432DRAFT_387214 [Lepidopterella palustris CBS 459.81]|uniref:Uncharacterized protein n=1 Tax=Lepidopterella palustris CBS 459.81 TaxID=1314670 RepID=A0A8E2DY46_9PEZI|nr:hypothetical protein K432DRAFT_387214 [Lepidopterella palustris CBS 459.81]
MASQASLTEAEIQQPLPSNSALKYPQKPNKTPMDEKEEKEYELILVKAVREVLPSFGEEFILVKPGRDSGDRLKWENQWESICIMVSKRCSVTLSRNVAFRNLLDIITRFENNGNQRPREYLHPYSHQYQYQLFSPNEPDGLDLTSMSNEKWGAVLELAQLWMEEQGV